MARGNGADNLVSMPQVPTHKPLSYQMQAVKYISDEMTLVYQRGDRELCQRMQRIFRDRHTIDSREGGAFSPKVLSGEVENLRKLKKKHANRDDASIAEFRKILQGVDQGLRNDESKAYARSALGGIISYLEEVKAIIAQQGVESKGSIGSRLSRAFGFGKKKGSESAATAASSSDGRRPMSDEELDEELLDAAGEGGVPVYYRPATTAPSEAASSASASAAAAPPRNPHQR